MRYFRGKNLFHKNLPSPKISHKKYIKLHKLTEASLKDFFEMRKSHNIIINALHTLVFPIGGAGPSTSLHDDRCLAPSHEEEEVELVRVCLVTVGGWEDLGEAPARRLF